MGAWNMWLRTAYFSSSWIWVVEKSGTVARSSPRSRASTCRPSSVSSCAMMDAVQPNPTSTTSTGSSRFAIVPPSDVGAHARAIPAQDADGRQRVGLSVLSDFLDVVVPGPGKADQLPASEPAVAAVHRIGQESFLRVLPQHGKKSLGGNVSEFDLAGFQITQDFVLPVGGQFGKRTAAVLPAAVRIDSGNRDTVQLGWRLLQLVALLRGAGCPGAFHVPAVGTAVGAPQLQIDEQGNVGFDGARVFAISGDQAGGRRFDEAVFVRREESAGNPGGSGRRPFAGGQDQGGGQGQRSLDESAFRFIHVRLPISGSAPPESLSVLLCIQRAGHLQVFAQSGQRFLDHGLDVGILDFLVSLLELPDRRFMGSHADPVDVHGIEGATA